MNELNSCFLMRLSNLFIFPSSRFFIKKRPFQYAITPHTARSELVVRVSPTPRNFFSPNTDSIFFCVIIYFSCILFLPIPPSHMPYTFLYSRHSKTEYNLYFAKILPLIYFRLFFILLQFYNIRLSVTFHSGLLGYNAVKNGNPCMIQEFPFRIT